MLQISDFPTADRFISKTEVLRIAGFSAATLWREVKAGRFPKPISTSPNRVGFLESEIRQWVASKITSARKRSASAQGGGARVA